nr:unnamed protein product [Spirometra erinaceieuropaei]
MNKDVLTLLRTPAATPSLERVPVRTYQRQSGFLQTQLSKPANQIKGRRRRALAQATLEPASLALGSLPRRHRTSEVVRLSANGKSCSRRNRLGTARID